MAKDVIKVDGEDAVVREDTARAYRGTHWAVTSLVVMLAILLLLFAIFFIKSSFSKPQNAPASSNQNKFS